MTLPEMSEVAVRVLSFDDLDARTAYAVWALRQHVFVVEQQSIFGDLDGQDLLASTRHLLALDRSDHPRDPGVLGYLRLLEDLGATRIGRVVVAPAARGQGVADVLMRAALAEVGAQACRLDAQTPLVRWYARYGFEVTGPAFDDAGIEHLPMVRPGAQEAFRTP